MGKIYKMEFTLERCKDMDIDKLYVSSWDSEGNTDKVTFKLQGVMSPYRMRKMFADVADRFFLAYGLETLMKESEREETEMENEQNFFIDYKHFKTM